MDAPIQVTVLGRVAVTGDVEGRGIARRQARELLGLFVANRDVVLTTADIVDALWDDEPPATATTIVHGHIRRIRSVLGDDAVVHDGDGYRLDLSAEAVDLWSVDEALRGGDRQGARVLWRDPAFGAFADRPWAQAALAGMGHLAGVAAESDASRHARRISPAGRLVGRRREIAAVVAAMSRSRLVSIVGLGGVGKSRLALEVAASAGATLHVDLGASVGSVATRVAGDLGLVTTGEPSWDRRAVESMIGRRDVLLVVDGCEHDVSGAADVIGNLLGGCPGLRVLATSRTALGTESELVVPLLPFTDPGNPDGDAVTLLLDRMATLGVEADPRDRRRLAAMCEQLAGVPLAIELAAVEAIFGVDGPSGGSVSHRAAREAPSGPARVVDDTVGHTIGQLTPAAARAVRRLGRLHHGFTPSLLRALVGPDASAVGVLYELRATGLVTDAGVSTAGRLGLPDPVRVRAVDDSDARALEAVVAALGGVVGAVRPDLGAPADHTALPAAIAEFANVDSILGDLEASGNRPAALRLAVQAAEAWGEAGRWVRGGTTMRRLVGSVTPEGVALPVAVVPRGDGAVPPAPVDPIRWADAVRATVVASATYAATREDVARLRVAASIASRGDEPLLEAHLVFRLALGAGYGGDIPTAQGHLDRLFELASVTDNAYLESMAEHIVALGELVGGAPAAAASGLHGVAERLTMMGAVSDAARCQRIAGLAWVGAGMLDEALGGLNAARALALRAGARGTEATIRSDLVEVHRRQGDLDRRIVTEARESVLAVGNLRAAGLLGIQLAKLDADPATLAHAALDLLASDRVWSAVAIAELVPMLPRRHPLRRAAPRLVAGLRTQWGSPLGPEEARIVDAIAHDAVGEVTWSDDMDAEVHSLLRDVTLGHAAGRG